MNTSMGFGMWIFWIVLIVIVVFLAKMMMGGPSGQPGVNPESPLNILQKRYASGEIDKDEFESMKKELEK
ncbi:MAG: electron transporter RnfE [Thiotrichaceae bacterium]|nr:MAG: electron transporter RnfE [Thiotrichaceae bacterium]